jgi:hypothetical protein
MGVGSISNDPAFALPSMNPAKIVSDLSIKVQTVVRLFGASEERQRAMVHYSGVWIDHRQAVIVSLSGSEPTVTRIESEAEKHVRSASGSRQAGSGESHHGTPEDVIDRKFDNHLKSYYEEVAEGLKGSAAILVMGPGEARTEFQKQIKSKELLAKVVGNEKCDKMTDPQLVARVREFFATHARTA